MTFSQITNILMTLDGTQPLISLLQSNVGVKDYWMYTLQSILNLALRFIILPPADPASKHTLITTHTSTVEAWNADFPPSVADVKNAVTYMVRREVIEKKRFYEMLRSSAQAISKENHHSISEDMLYRLGTWIFTTCFHLAGDYTTYTTAMSITAVVECIGVMEYLDKHWSSGGRMDAENRRARAKILAIYGADQLALISETVQHLLQRLEPPPMRILRVSWTLLSRVPYFLTSIRLLQMAIVGDGQQCHDLPFIITLDRSITY